jgi:DNA-binding Lrp family transcriptional regulator
MMRAYVLINTRIGAIPAVIHNLRSLKTVKEAEMTFGEYDVVVVVEVNDVRQLADVVAKDIQTIPDIIRTTTCMAVKID